MRPCAICLFADEVRVDVERTISELLDGDDDLRAFGIARLDVRLGVVAGTSASHARHRHDRTTRDRPASSLGVDLAESLDVIAATATRSRPEH